MSDLPAVGTLAFDGKVYGQVVWTQPGGPGTEVFPQQQPAERVAMFVFGCGHWANHLDIKIMGYMPPAQPLDKAAYVLCPLCSFVNRIIYPTSLLYDPIANYIVLP
jgi:hypothetical protein